MDPSSPTFSSGLELANFVVSSELPNHSWAAIRNLYREISQQEGLSPSPSPSVRFKVDHQQPNCTIIVFFTWPACSKDYIQGGGDLISSATLKETFPLFEFLCTEDNPHVSINKATLELFASIPDSPLLKSDQIDNSNQLIITGNSLGGSVASLFTLSLLETLDLTTTKCPLCITFGSPLIGDDGLQKAISKYPTWSSCFLHIVSDQDPIPRVLLSLHNSTGSASQNNVYKPFGTFLLYSQLRFSCFEDSQSILDLLMETYSVSPENQNPNQVFELYERFVKDLWDKEIFKDTTQLVKWNTESFKAGIITQLEAIRLVQPQSLQQQQQNMGIDHLITNIEKQEKKLAESKAQVFDPSKKLNDRKVHMTHLEWYKKESKNEKIGYYDSYKNGNRRRDIDVVNHKKILTLYWKEMVDEAEKKPQKEGASFRTRWLYAGTNYRRMIEPLDIAEYYKGGGKDYINQGRSKHYKKLGQWLNETKTEKSASGPNYLKKQNVASNLTEDSCFWAHVEEALTSCKLLSSKELSTDREKEKSKLIEFESYVYNLMKNYAVSPEIFLQESSFMKWWKEHKKIIGTSYSSRLTDLMKNVKNYDLYASGELEFPECSL